MTDQATDVSKKYDPALLLPQWDGHVHKLPIRVYYEDTDAGGIVYHSCYVNYAERGRTELLRALGYDHTNLVKEHEILFVVRKMTVDYRRAAVLDDLLVLETRCSQVRGASFIMDQRVMRGEDLMVGLDVKVACISTEMKACPVPEQIVHALLGNN